MPTFPCGRLRRFASVSRRLGARLPTAERAESRYPESSKLLPPPPPPPSPAPELGERLPLGGDCWTGAGAGAAGCGVGVGDWVLTGALGEAAGARATGAATTGAALALRRARERLRAPARRRAERRSDRTR
jgi:hypothetical protein